MFLDKYNQEIISLCKDYNVKSLSVFGSVLTPYFNDESDIDFVVDLHSKDPIEYGENYFDFKFQLEKLLQKPIDLLELKALNNNYLIQSINRTKKAIYEA